MIDTFLGWLPRWLPCGSGVKDSPATQETQVGSLGHADSLEVEILTQSSILAWRIPCIEEPCRLESIGSQRVQHD